MRLRRIVMGCCAATMLLGASVLVFSGPANAAWQNFAVLWYGSQGGYCGGNVGVGNNLYNYPETVINTPNYGYPTCYATQAEINWGNNFTTVSALSGASAVAYGAQGSPANYGDALGCPGVYNCGGWQGNFYP